MCATVKQLVVWNAPLFCEVAVVRVYRVEDVLAAVVEKPNADDDTQPDAFSLRPRVLWQDYVQYAVAYFVPRR